jgi:hypothetical protein
LRYVLVIEGFILVDATLVIHSSIPSARPPLVLTISQ